MLYWFEPFLRWKPCTDTDSIGGGGWGGAKRFWRHVQLNLFSISCAKYPRIIIVESLQTPCIRQNSIQFCLTTYMCLPLGALVVILRCAVNEMFLIKISYVLIAVFTVQEVALSRFLKHIWSTIFFIYTVYALLPVRLLAAIIAGLTLAFVHLPFYFYSLDSRYHELHWRTVTITLWNQTFIIEMQINNLFLNSICIWKISNIL